MVGYAGVSDGSLEVMANASVGMTFKSEEKEGRELGVHHSYASMSWCPTRSCHYRSPTCVWRSSGKSMALCA